MLALPLMLYASSPRLPAGFPLPAPAVPYQFMLALGPAWKTFPPPTLNSQAWLSPRYDPFGSGPIMGATRASASKRQPPVWLNTSPSLVPWLCDGHEPP